MLGREEAVDFLLNPTETIDAFPVPEWADLATIGISIIFIAVFALAIVFPYIPGAPSLMR